MLRFIIFSYFMLISHFTYAFDNLVDANNQFALDVYAQLHTQQGNLFFSPYSISTALAMTYAGAKANTAQQMADTLHFSTLNNVHEDYAALQSTLNQLQNATKLNIVNAIWYEQSYHIQTDYQTLIENTYANADDKVLNQADFINKSDTVRRQINQWVEQQTQDKIKDLLSADSVGADTMAALVNAIYFKAAWLYPFRTAMTEKQPFHLNAKQTKQVDMMQQTKTFQYMENDLLQLVALPYQNNDFSMLIALPKQNLAKLEKQLNIAVWISELEAKTVTLSLPQFRVKSSFDLVKTLQALGMHDAFDAQQANFSGMIDSEHKFAISAVVHQAFIEIDEQGTEAAAATAVIMTRSAMLERKQSVKFIADRPFLFFIKDNHTHSILFLGRIIDPSMNF
jgi:serpin B